MTRRISLQVELASLLALAAVLLSCAMHVPAQQSSPAQPPAETAAPRTFAYEAVTIKHGSPDNSFWKFTPDGFTTGGMPVSNLFRSAFGVVMDDQIVGLPAWAKAEPLTVEAKMDADTAAALEKLPPMERWKQTQLMLQSLLGDRFALKFHHDTKELPTYDLTVAKGGSRMKRSASETGGHAEYSSGKVEAAAVSMENFAMNLSFTAGRIVLNRTGLEGGYDFTLDYAPEGADASDTRPSLFTALEEQLGLKLVPSKGPVDVIVIDHIERPTEN